jgi:hypothetical protein
MRNVSLDLVARPGILVPLDQTTGNVNFVVIKTTLAPNQAAELLKNAVASVDPNQGVFFFNLCKAWLATPSPFVASFSSCSRSLLRRPLCCRLSESTA